MEQKINKNGIIALVVIIIVFLLTLVVLLVTGTISFKSDNTARDTHGSDTNINEKVDINLSIGNVSISKDAPNSKILVDGTIDLLYDSSKYAGVTLSGYCL